jgi:hypothetical protein
VLAKNLPCKGVHQKESHQISAIRGALTKALEIFIATCTPVRPHTTSPKSEQSASISTNRSNTPKVFTAPLAPLAIIQQQSPTSGGRFVSYPREYTKKQVEELYKKLKQTPLTHKSGFIYVYRHQDIDGILKLRYSQDIEARMTSMKRKCCLKIEPIPIPDTSQRVVQYVRYAEQLVFETLAYCRLKQNKCWGCRRSHIEFFWVTEAKGSGSHRRYQTMDRGNVWRC